MAREVSVAAGPEWTVETHLELVDRAGAGVGSVSGRADGLAGGQTGGCGISWWPAGGLPARPGLGTGGG